MPYKQPERKRQWERENREHRNALRRERYAEQKSFPSIPRPGDMNLTPRADAASPWKVILGCAVGALILVGVVVGGSSGYRER